MKGTARMLLSLLAASGLFLTLFLVLHWNPIVSFLLSAGVYFGLFFLLKPSRKIAGLRLDGLKDGEELLTLLQGAQEDLDLGPRLRGLDGKADPGPQ